MNALFRKARPLWATLVVVAFAAFVVAYLIEGTYEVPLRDGSFRFARPWAASLLLGAVLVLLARGWLQRRAAPRLLVSRGRELAMSNGGFRPLLRDGATGLRVTAVALMSLALMGPQSIHARDRLDLEGIDLVLVLDLSLSMQAADIVPNRFEATKQVVEDFIVRRPNDRIGAVVFGRDAYTLMPLTSDKEALRNVVRELSLDVIDGRGTAIGNGVATGLNRLRRSDAKSKVLVLLTDGDSNSGNVSPEQAAEFAEVMGVKVFTVLMGQTEDAPVERGRDLFGRPLFDTGTFPVNPELLQRMASATGGEYYQAVDRQSLERSFHSILDRLEKSEIEDTGKVYGELFPAFLWPAFVFLSLEALLAALVLRRWP